MTEDQIKHMVIRFLGWRLPKPWNPDNGVSYKRPNYAHAPTDHDWPVGTNLFDSDQATAMVRYMLEGLPSKPIPSSPPAGPYTAESLEVIALWIGINHGNYTKAALADALNTAFASGAESTNHKK